MLRLFHWEFPISRDPPEGGTPWIFRGNCVEQYCFQFLGIPPKGELRNRGTVQQRVVSARFQFLGIPPKGEQDFVNSRKARAKFPISRDPPEGGTRSN